MAFLIDQSIGGLPLPRRRAPARPDAADPAAADPIRVLEGVAQGRRVDLLRRAALMALLGGGLLWGALTAAEALLSARGPAGTAAAAAPAGPAWSEIIRPIPVYDLGGTDFEKLPRSYRARRDASDGTREDVLSFGTPDAGPTLRIALRRSGDGAARTGRPGLADALAQVAGLDGETVTRVRPLPPVETRFGPVERADLMLWSGGGGATACQGFRGLPDGGTVLGFAGLACAAPDHALAENAVACAVDRIDLLSAGDDRALQDLFVAAERRPGAAGCREGVLAHTAPPPSTPGPFAELRRRAAWLEAGPDALPLRGALGTADPDR